MPRIMLALAVTLTLASPAFAKAPPKACTAEPESKWQSHDAAKAKLTAEGYAIRKIETEKNCFEVYVTDKDGKKSELFLDPVSLSVVAKED